MPVDRPVGAEDDASGAEGLDAAEHPGLSVSTVQRGRTMPRPEIFITTLSARASFRMRFRQRLK